MDLTFDAEDDDFRERARTWLTENIPKERRPEDGLPMRQFDCEWQRVQHDGGWAGVSWPASAGGLDLSVLQQLIWWEEYGRARAPYTGCLFAALNYAGPALMVHGTEAQRTRHLPRILRGEEVWAQGFSEPDGGSDLASLRTRGTIDGDTLVVTGQKTWSSYADIADVHFCLIRTSTELPGRHGLSWVICDLADPNVDVRPIKTMARNHHFSEVFYDGARVPLDNVVGGLHNGWAVAMSTLNFERGTAFLADQLELTRTIERLIAEAAERPGPAGSGRAIEDDHIAMELAQLRSAGLALRSLTYRSISRVRRTGGPPGPEGSIIRMYYAEVRQWVARLAMEILGPAGLRFQPYWEDGWSGLYLWDFGRTIGAGTAEIQRNVIGERVLGLPR